MKRLTDTPSKYVEKLCFKEICMKNRGSLLNRCKHYSALHNYIFSCTVARCFIVRVRRRVQLSSSPILNMSVFVYKVHCVIFYWLFHKSIHHIFHIWCKAMVRVFFQTFSAIIHSWGMSARPSVCQSPLIMPAFVCKVHCSLYPYEVI